jgi:hypothetical protein
MAYEGVSSKPLHITHVDGVCEETSPGKYAVLYAGPRGPGSRPRPAADFRTQGHFRGPSPQDVTLMGVMLALVSVQAYMLADTVVAIPRWASPSRQWCER